MATDGRVNVTLGFKGDMTQLNKDLDNLTMKLRSLGQGKGILGGEQAITKEMNSAMNSASKLSTIMQKCRMDNGKLDVAALKEAMERTGMSAKTLAAEFKSLGPQGVAAFNEIAKAVQTAQVPMQKSQGMLREFATTMKNTMKWQISSSILHGFMSSISGAYGYAQDLNESLNNIRIVSKQNTDQMAEFAREANKAAKELSISTTAYTDAALIFYQQGLEGADVTERTDVVAKMSNVTKDSVDEVSSYMTAIWNNFDDGSESLEHYADVITGLGAATASSSAEIAAGLEKFAAVADTVGLSYDYATSALATVVAQTRQSADTVGTAFKTLFARIEGLKLGETLDDGVDLNKYSQALAAVGVNILDANGRLKEMDTILDEMGSKWSQIGKEQQVALAQTVAGTRQYNQLVALMDNWDKVQENLQVARSSDGELQSQADIYAESWEAAQKRVKTAWQTIYSSLIDEDFFIKLANGAEKFLTIIGKIIDALGGFKGIWPLLITGLTQLFGGDIGINIGNFIVRFKAGLEEAKGVFKEFKEGFVQEDITLNVNVNNNAMAGVMEDYKKLISTITETQQTIDKTDVLHQNLFNDILQRVMSAIDAEVKAREALDNAVNEHDKNVAEAQQMLTNAEYNTNTESEAEVKEEPLETNDSIKNNYNETADHIDNATESTKKFNQANEESEQIVENLNEKYQRFSVERGKAEEQSKAEWQQEKEATAETAKNMEDVGTSIVSVTTKTETLNEEISQINTDIAAMSERYKQLTGEAPNQQVLDIITLIAKVKQESIETEQNIKGIGQALQKDTIDAESLEQEFKEVEEDVEKTKEVTAGFADGVNPAISALQKMLDSSKISLTDFIAIFKEMQNGSLGETFGEMGVEHFPKAISNLNTIVQEIENAEKAGGATNEQLQKLVNIIEEISSAQVDMQDGITVYAEELGLSDEQAAELKQKILQVLKSSDEAAEKAVKLAEAFSEAKTMAKGASEESDKINKGLNNSKTKAETYAQTFQTTLMDASRFATILTQINNLVDQFQNKDPGEAFKSLIVSLPMILFNLKSAHNFITGIHSGLTAILAGEDKQSILKALNLKLTKKQADAQADIAKNETVETVNDKLQSQLKRTPTADGKGTFMAGVPEAGAAGAATEGTAGLGGLAGGAAAAATAAAVILAIAAIAGVTAYVVHKVNMKKLSEEAERAALKESKQSEKIEKSTEELKAITDLADKYDQLKAQIDEQSISREQAKAQAIELAAAYENEALMIMALTGAYDDLDNKIKEVQAEQQKETIQDLEQGIEYNKNNVLAQVQKAAGSAKDELGYLWDLGHGKHQQTENAMERLLGRNVIFDAGTKLDKQTWEKIWEKTGTDPEAFKQFQYDIAAAAAQGEDSAKHLKEWMDTAQESIKAAAENAEKLKKIKLESAFTEVYNELDGALTTAEQFFDFIERIKNLDPDASYSDIINMASTHANTQDMSIYGQTAMVVTEEKDWDLEIKVDREKYDTFINDIEKIDGDTIAVLGIEPALTGELVDDDGHLNVDNNSLGITSEQLKTLGGVQAEKSEIYKVQDAMNRFDPDKASKGKGWSEKDRKEMAGIEDLDLNASDEQIFEQLRKLEEEHIAVLEEKKKAADELTESLAKLAEQYKIYKANGADDQFLNGVDMSSEKAEEEINQRYQNALTTEITQMNITGEDFTKDLNTKEFFGEAADLAAPLKEAQDAGKGIVGQLEVIAEYYDKHLPKSGEEFDEKLSRVYDDLGITQEEDIKLIENAIRKRRAASDGLKGYKSKLDAYTGAVSALSAEYEAQADSLENLQKRVAAASSGMDNMQAAYKSLKTIEAQYAEDKFLTVDSFQEILSMEPQYLSALEFENGQLKVNEQTLQEVAIARVQNMESQQAELMLKELDIIATKGEDDQERQHLLTKYASIAANQVAGFTMEAVAAKARELANANSDLAQTYLNVASAAETYAAAADATIKGLKTDFPKAMGYTPKGGSGSKKSKENKDLKEWADEFDRFYPLQKVIDDLADAISDLAKEQEHLAGGELIGAIRKQNKLLQEQKKAYQDLAKEQKVYQKEMQADLAKYGMSFDTASGNIVNYAEATQAMLDQYNAAIEKYNKSAQKDADKKALEAVEKEYEKFKKLVSNYQGILTEIQDTENKLDDIYYETIANNLKEFEIMVEVKLDIGEARRMVNDFVKEINQNFKTLRKTTSEWLDVFESALANAKTYTEGDLGTVNVDLDAYNKVKNAIDSGDYGHEGAMFASETEAITKLKELGEQLKDDSMDLYNIWKDAWEDYIDAVDETLDQWEDLMDGFDDINDELDHWERITELVRKAGDQENDYQVYLDIYDKKMQNEEQRQIALNRQIDALEREYKELINSGASELDEDVQKIKEKMEDASKALYDSVEAYLEALNNRYDKQFEYENKKSIEQALGFSIDEMTTQWDRAKKAEEGYYDANQRIYQLDRLRRKYADVINNTDDLKQKQKLAKMQETELKKLEEKKALSEGDLQIAEKKLAVQQAQIALEEARDNRSQMRLQRDSQGNWSYQFVADEGNIEDKKQALMDAANELYETVKKNEEESIESIRNIYNTWLEERQNLSRESFESDEAYLAALEELDQYYKDLIETRVGTLNGYRQEQNQATSELLLASYVVNKESYGEMTEAQQKLIDKLKEHSIKDMADIATATDEKYEAIKEKAEEINQQSIAWWDELAKICAIDTEQMAEANEDFYNFVRNLLDQYNADVEAARNASRLAIDDVGSAVEDLGNKITDTADRVDDLVARTDQLSVFRERVNAIEDAWKGVKQSIESALASLKEYLNRLIEVRDMQDVVKKNVTSATGSVDLNKNVGGGTSNNGPNGTSPQSSDGPEKIASSTIHQQGSTGNFVLELVSDKGNYKTLTIGKNPNAADINDLKSLYEVGANWPENFIKLRGSYYSPSYNTTEKVSSRADNGNSDIKVSNNNTTPASSEYRMYENDWANGFWRMLWGYDTGGYTGSWSEQTPEKNNGKLAWLHQKELVLNQSDTKNILDAVDIVRTMKSNNSDFINYIIDSLNAGTEQLIHTLEYGIHSIADRVEYTSDIMAQAVDRGSKDRSPLEQNVHIDASFPNVQSSFEIETALNNLVNVASQRAHSDEILTW